jgi:hypothetical protein
MRDQSLSDGLLRRWRARRASHAMDARALQSEFELDRPRGLAALRALGSDVGALERERLRTHAGAPPAAVSRPERAPARTR